MIAEQVVERAVLPHGDALRSGVVVSGFGVQCVHSLVIIQRLDFCGAQSPGNDPQIVDLAVPMALAGVVCSPSIGG